MRGLLRGVEKMRESEEFRGVFGEYLRKKGKKSEKGGVEVREGEGRWSGGEEGGEGGGGEDRAEGEWGEKAERQVEGSHTRPTPSQNRL